VLLVLALPALLSQARPLLVSLLLLLTLVHLLNARLRLC
jgi:hypothetical protein